MLIIFEGADKSGKSLYANLIAKKLNAILIKKSYNKLLYPIDFTKASLHDWETLFDRVILSNPDQIFVADRSFMTQIIYQYIYGHGESKVQDIHIEAHDKYLKVLASIKHLCVLCESDQYELDSMVTSIDQVNKLKAQYRRYFEDIMTTHNLWFINDKKPVSMQADALYTHIRTMLDTNRFD